MRGSTISFGGGHKATRHSSIAAARDARPHPGSHGQKGLVITVTAGTGVGPTGLAAFDASLRSCGAENFNLVRLSSVIPAGTTIRTAVGPSAPIGEWGDRLYVVYAHERAIEPGTEAWAGVGWIQAPDTGVGLFVEHEGATEAFVRSQIALSIESISAARHLDFAEPEMVVIGCQCAREPVAATVIAAFTSEGWDARAPVAL